MIFTWCSRDHHIPASRSTINPSSTRGFHVMFTWFSRGVLKKFLRTNLEFYLGQIPDFTLSRILHEQIPDFTLSRDFTLDKFQILHYPEFCMNKSRILHYPGILPWTNSGFYIIPGFYHGQIPNFAHFGEFRAILKLPCF